MIKVKVTKEKFDELFSIEDWLNFSELSNVDMYNNMIKFVVDDNDEPMEEKAARKLFKSVPKKEWGEYVIRFMNAISESYISPTNGGS